jgi:glycosyltransferase involved in cell wall biosynthesis
VSFRDVRPALVSRSRFGYPIELASFAATTTRALRRERGRYDVIDVRNLAAWENDVVFVDAVVRAEQERWPEELGRVYRAAPIRAKLAPALHPAVAVRRTVQRLQFRPGRFLRAVAETEKTRDDLTRIHGVPAELIEVIPPPCDVASFASPSDSASRAELGVPEDACLLLFVGHDFERKGLAAAIAALPRLQGAHLAVVGGGNQQPFEGLARADGVGERVHFLGRSEQPERFYPTADIFVLPTRSDPWANTLIEAMAAGLPVVTTSAAGAAAVVKDARAGIVLAGNSVAELADAIAQLTVDPALRRELGKRGQAIAPDFDATAHARAMMRVYEAALNDRATNP